MSPILQLRGKTALLIALTIIGALGIWAICSDSTDCGYRPGATNGNRTPASSPVPSPLAHPNNTSPNASFVDEDQDGLDDFEEDQLASRFAPIVYHGQCES